MTSDAGGEPASFRISSFPSSSPVTSALLKVVTGVKQVEPLISSLADLWDEKQHRSRFTDLDTKALQERSLFRMLRVLCHAAGS